MDEFDPAAFEADLAAILAESNAAFRGKYGKQLNDLVGLSRAEIDAISPGITDLQKYDELIAVVKAASRTNLAQAQLKKRIEALGKVAMKVAKKVPSLAALLV